MDYQNFWDRFYDSAYYNPSQRHRFRLIAEEVKAIIKKNNLSRQKIRLMDLGCGLGHLIAHLKKVCPEISYHGTDISEKAIAELKKNMPDVEWGVADFQKSPAIHGAPFDIVICSEVLEHCAQPTQVLQTATSVVCPGGWLIVTVPGGQKYRIDQDLGHLRHYQQQDLINLIPDNSFFIQKKYAWGWPFLNGMRACTDIFYDYATKNYLNKKYGWAQKMICHLIYMVMFASIRGKGCQLVGVYQKNQMHLHTS